ncbi:cyclin N-terminal domain-containing protein 2 isoform X3 [Corythoichthys intestinalis]|uniref:cyclin N-terminal domain-containing protein 2 isoform X3 n=1 Tax=Corythoichthys intestinalis TaxID=161448 RepID=UPI0025A68F0F|nr:cyclin N-terminal domain-containing protein 2 isoform X3 [Corythoichthys intestinalis]
MARTGFRDTKPLLDLHKADDRQGLIKTLQVACGPTDRWQPVEESESRLVPEKDPEPRWIPVLPSRYVDGILSAKMINSVFVGFMDKTWTYSSGTIVPSKDGCLEEPLLRHNLSLPGLHSLQALVPSLLRHEVELALEKLELVWDRTFAWEMFLDMMRSQTWQTLPNTEMTRHFSDVTRAVLVDWLIQVHEMLHFQEETLYLAIHLLNRSLRLVKVTTANLQLLGIVCLFLAAKKEECLLPEVSGLCYLMDHAYTKHQLLRMERKVLTGLKFNLSYCPPLHFLLLLSSIARCSAQMVWMARYLLELSLLEGRCVAFLPLQLAGAALCLARHVLKEPQTPEGEAAWCLASGIHTGSETVLLRIIQILAGAAARAQTRETSPTFIKFSSRETMHVSRHPGLNNVSTLMGICI